MRIGNEVLIEDGKLSLKSPLFIGDWKLVWKRSVMSYDRPSGRTCLPGYSIAVFVDAHFRTVYVAKVGAERHSVYASQQAPWDGESNFFVYRNSFVSFDKVDWQAVEDRLLSLERGT